MGRLFDQVIKNLTISGGSITIDGPGVYTVGPETGSADNLDNIVDTCTTGDRIVLIPTNSCSITLRRASGNIYPPVGLSIPLGSANSGSVVATMKTCELVKDSNGYWLVMGSGSGNEVIAEHRVFQEQAGAGTYTATIAIPSEATVLDVRWMNTVLWDTLTSATLNVGDTDDTDGYFAGIDLLTVPIANVNGAGGISSFLGDTGSGAYSKLTKYYSTGENITATVVTVGATGNAGRSRLTVVYAVGDVIGAVKVLT